jgi:hypothetical protein
MELLSGGGIGGKTYNPPALDHYDIACLLFHNSSIRGAAIPTRHLEALPGLRIGRDGLMRRVSEPLGFGVLAALILQAHSSVICAERYWFAADSGVIPGAFKAKVMFWSISPEPDRIGSSSPTATKPRDSYR